MNRLATAQVDGGVIVMQGIFAGLFVSELCIRWAAEGFKDFWRSNDLGWNLSQGFSFSKVLIPCSFFLTVLSPLPSGFAGDLYIFRGRGMV